MTGRLLITEVVLRDAHQSLLASRLRLDDLLPAAADLDRAGFWSVESWGGATFDACIRHLGEDPWERLRALKRAMPHTRQQMLLRGQNLVGYRHHADDLVRAFVERAAHEGVDVFRVFDAMNDLRNVDCAIRSVLACERHAQGAMAYTTSPVHTLATWRDLARRFEDLGCHSICIKDMAGLLRPYAAFELVSMLKETVAIPVAMQCHATTGLSTASIIKAVEAGIDMVDTAISSLSMTYGHSATESVAAIFEGTERDPGLDRAALDRVADHFRAVRRRHARFEGSLRGVDARILRAQVPGGMLTHLEEQLREQHALDRMDEVLDEIERVRADLGHPPLVTPNSQIVGTQALMNVLDGSRYHTIARETAGIVRGEYGATPAPIDPDLAARVLDGAEPITCRPADLLEPEWARWRQELEMRSRERGFALSARPAEDALIYALFPQAGLHFLEHRDDPAAFETSPGVADEGVTRPVRGEGPARYRVRVEGREFEVEVDEAGASAVRAVSSSPATAGQCVPSPLAGTVNRVLVAAGQAVAAGEPVIVLEVMKMETEVRAPRAGLLSQVTVSEGDAVALGDVLFVMV